MTLPVYFINGFLESGKTEFINYTIEEDYFKIDELTLIIACEEGEVEYDEKALKNGNAVLEILDGETDFTIRNLTALEKKYHPERIIIEFNGMWNPKNVLLPRSWHMEEQITLINATTFPVYFANMKSQMAEMVRNADVVVFNRCDGIDELASYRRSIRAVNQQCDIVFEDSYGEIDDDNLGIEDLPYDLESDTIVLNDDTYATWYLDAMEHVGRYVGKTVEFLAMVMHQDDFPAGWFVPGRIAMVCCEEDVAFLGFPCRWDEEAKLRDQQWVRVRATVSEAEWFEYEGVGPVLHAQQVLHAEPAEQLVVGVK